MINDGLLDEPVFSFRIGASESDGGEATFGGVDHQAYTGSITYVPVRRKAYWEVELEQVAFGEDILDLEMTGAAIDTGRFPLCLTKFNSLPDYMQAPPSSHSLPTSLRCSTPKSEPPVPGMVNTKSTVLKSRPFLNLRSTLAASLTHSREAITFWMFRVHVSRHSRAWISTCLEARCGLLVCNLFVVASSPLIMCFQVMCSSADTTRFTTSVATLLVSPRLLEGFSAM
jgi:hypothetical protein